MTQQQRLLLIGTLVLLWLPFTGLVAMRSFAQRTINAPEVMGSMAGVVVDHAAAPVNGVTVNLYKQGSYDWPLHKTMTTDSTGRFLFDHLPTGLYRLGFSDRNGRYYKQFYADAPDLGRAKELAITGNHLAGLMVHLKPAAQIAGTLALADGSIPQSLALTLYQLNGNTWWIYRYLDWYSPTQVITPFLFGELESGVYRLVAHGRHRDDRYFAEYFDNAFSLNKARDISVTVGALATGITIVLGENPAGATLAGRVVGNGSLPLPNISVTAYQTTTTGWDSGRTVTTNNQGEYQFQLLEPSLYLVQFSDASHVYSAKYFREALSLQQATPISLTPGISLNQGDIQLVPTGQITGVINRFDGVAPEFGTLVLYKTVNGGPTFSNYYSVYRGEDGILDYKLTGVDAGHYHIKASANYQSVTLEEYYQDAPTLDQATAIVVQPGQTTGAIHFNLGDRATMATIGGHVTKPDGTPFPGIQVEAASLQALRSFTAQTNLLGAYLITVTTPGTYTVKFSDATGAYLAAYYDNVNADELATPIVVNAGDARVDVNAILSPTGQITGVVTMYDGTAPSSPSFKLYRWVTDEWQESYLYPTVRSDENAAYFVFKNLPPALYRLGARSAYWNEPDDTAYYSNTVVFTDATNLTVTYGATVANVNFVLGEDRANARIAGIVWDETTPVPDVKVELYHDILSYGSWPLQVYVYTDQEGRYQIDGLAAGRYRLAFRRLWPPDVYAPPIYWGGASELDGAAVIELSSTTNFDASITLNRPYSLFLPVVTR